MSHSTITIILSSLHKDSYNGCKLGQRLGILGLNDTSPDDGELFRNSQAKINKHLTSTKGKISFEQGKPKECTNIRDILNRSNKRKYR